MLPVPFRKKIFLEATDRLLWELVASEVKEDVTELPGSRDACDSALHRILLILQR